MLRSSPMQSLPEHLLSIAAKGLVDAHAHVYPQKIADKACAGVAAFYGLSRVPVGGTPEHLLAERDAFGVSRTVVHSVATTREQVRSVNDFLAAQGDCPRFWPFGTLHPDMDAAEIRDELARMQALGLHGLKLHPDCQRFAVDGPRGRRILEAVPPCFPVLLHAGDRRFDFSHPAQIAAVARDYPHLRFVAAHFGGWSEWDRLASCRGLPNLWFDTSSTIGFIGPSRAAALLRELGPDRFFFATDYPMWSIRDELRLVGEMDLGDNELEAVFHLNAERVLGIPPSP